MEKATFYLGSNSGTGFYSLFEPAMGEQPGRENFLLKGGPGCGKSTLMRALADRLGCEEYIRCASDPDSLDGVLLPGNRLVLDATAPHTLDIPFHGASGGYLVTPLPKDRAGLQAKAPALRALASKSGGCYAGAYRLLGAAAKLEQQLRAALEPHIPAERLRRRAKGIGDRVIPKGTGTGTKKLRFLEGYTPAGWQGFYGTAAALEARQVWLLQDDWGLGAGMLEALRDLALERGQEVYACRSPLEPERLRHLIIPGVAAFMTADSRWKFEGGAHRKVRVEGYLAAPRFKGLRRLARELRSQIAALEAQAMAQLAEARAVHDQMEALYRPHLDAEGLNALLQQALEMME